MPTETLTEINKVIWPFLWDNLPDLVPREQATRPLSEGGLGIVDIPDKVRSIGMRAIELFRATAVEYDQLKEKPCWIMLAEQRLEAEINVAVILKNGWAGSRLEFKKRDQDQSARFWGMRGKGTEVCNRRYGRISRRNTKGMDGSGFVQMVACEERQWEVYKKSGRKWGLGEEQFKEAWKTTWESIRAKQHNQRV